MKINWSRYVLLLLMMAAICTSILSGCAAMTGKTAGETIDDATITTKVNGIIVDDPSAAFLKIDVDTREGNVTLSGYVPDRATEDRLVERIRKVNGVKSVESNLVIEPKE